MGQFSQARRPLTIQTALEGDPFLLVGLQGHEGVSELFQFDLDLRAAVDADIPVAAVIGRPAAVTVTGVGGIVRHIHGLICQLTRADQDDDFDHYHAQLVPKFWLWSRRIQSRIFQHRSVKEVLVEVLANLDVVFELHGDYPARNYCVQYQESDFAFASRLMEEEGISYFFRHSADKHQLVLTDRALQHPEIAPARVVYTRKDAPPDMPLVRRFARTHAVGIGRYTVRDYHHELPDQTLEASQKAPDSNSLGHPQHVLSTLADLEIFDYPTGHATQFTGIGPDGQARPGLQGIFPSSPRLARIRMEAETAACLTVRGEGNVASFLPGHVFRMERHPDGDHSYLLLHVEHEAKVDGARSGEALPLNYQNRFQGQPAALAYRPRRKTPRPIIAGPQTAVVVGLSDSTEPLLDRLGRVKVQFHWDRQGQHDARSSCWVRVSQVWAGSGWGAFFWPRPGHEVVVAFEGGDPDRPLIVGSVYNETNQPPTNPQVIPEVAGFKSCSLGGNANAEFNALLFSDKPGEERVHVHSQKNAIQTSESTRILVSREPAVDYYGAFTLQGGSGSGGGPESAGGSGNGVLPWMAFVDNGSAGASDFGLSLLGRVHRIPAHQSYNIGDSTTSTLAGRAYTESLFVPSMRFEFDISAVIKEMGLLGKAIGGAALAIAMDYPTIAFALATPLAVGISDTAFSQRTQQTYFGPIFDVARCSSYRFHGPQLFADAVGNEPRLDNRAADSVRRAAKAFALCLLTIRTTLGIANHVVNKPGKSTNQEWNNCQGLLNGLVVDLFHHLLMQLELSAAMAQTAIADTFRAQKRAELALAFSKLLSEGSMWLEASKSASAEAARQLTLAENNLNSVLKLSNGQVVGSATVDQAQHTYGNFTLRGTTGVTIETPRFDVYAHASNHPGNICLAAPDGRADITADQISLVAGSETAVVHATEKSAGMFFRPSFRQIRGIRLDNDSLVLTVGALPLLSKVRLELKEDGLTASCGLVSSIKITDNAVSLRCGKSKIELTPAGVVIAGPNVDITATMAMKLESLQFENKTQAISQVSAVVHQNN